MAQVSQVFFIVAHALAWGVGQFGDRLTIAPGHLDHDLQRLVTQVVRQVGAHTKSQLTTTLELLKQLNGARNRRGSLAA